MTVRLQRNELMTVRLQRNELMTVSCSSLLARRRNELMNVRLLLNIVDSSEATLPNEI